MAETDFSNYVVAEVANVGLDLPRLQDEQNIFAEEAFKFLLHNAHLWVEYPKDFLFLHTHPSSCRFFTANIGKAVVAQAYINRVKCREIFLNKQAELNSIEGYERFISEFAVLKDSLYFYNVLIWISTIFELTMFCYKRGYDYTVCGHQCLARYPDILHFHLEGGWTRFDDSVFLISCIIDQILVAPLKGTWFDEQTTVFLKYRKALERRHRYESNNWTKLIHGAINANGVKQKVSAKFRAVSALDPLRVFSGYKVIHKYISPIHCKDSNSDILVKNEKSFATQIQQGIGSENEGCTSKTGRKIRKLEISDVRPANFSFHMEYDVSKRDKFLCFSEAANSKRIEDVGELNQRHPFVISERFLKKEDIRVESQNYICGIKVCFSKGDYFVKNLNEIINENINRKNCCKIDEQVLAVYQSVCDYENSDTPVIVLDTSSEEEDDEETDIPELQFKFEQFSEIQEFSKSRSFNSSEKLQLENIYVCTEVPERRSRSSRSAGAILNIKSSTNSQRNNLQKTCQIIDPPNTGKNSSLNKKRLNEDYVFKQQTECCTGEIIGDGFSKQQANDAMRQIIPKSSTVAISKITSTEYHQTNQKQKYLCNTQFEEDRNLSRNKKNPEEECHDQESECYPEENTEIESVEQSSTTSLDPNDKSLTIKLRSRRVSKRAQFSRRKK